VENLGKEHVRVFGESPDSRGYFNTAGNHEKVVSTDGFDHLEGEAQFWGFEMSNFEPLQLFEFMGVGTTTMIAWDVLETIKVIVDGV
jgi:hypothetical protein